MTQEKPIYISEIYGERDRIRTCDRLIKSQMLYQLSYAPTLERETRCKPAQGQPPNALSASNCLTRSVGTRRRRPRAPQPWLSAILASSKSATLSDRNGRTSPPNMPISLTRREAMNWWRSEAIRNTVSTCWLSRAFILVI